MKFEDYLEEAKNLSWEFTMKSKKYGENNTDKIRVKAPSTAQAHTKAAKKVGMGKPEFSSVVKDLKRLD